MMKLRDLLPKKNAGTTQLRHLSKAAQIEETVNPFLSQMTILTLGGILAVMISWSAIANINEIARTVGEVEPSGTIRNIQHLDGGIVAAVHAREGEIVQKGQLLLTLDGADIREDLDRADQRLWSFRIEERRLRAYIDGVEPDFSDLGPSELPRIVDASMTYRAMVNAMADRRGVAQRQLLQRNFEIGALNARLETSRNLLVVLEELLERRRKLMRSGHLTEVQFLDTQQRVTQLKGEIEVTNAQIEQATASLAEFEVRAASVESEARSSAYQQLQDVQAQIADATELAEKLRGQVARLEIRSPVHGVVKGVTETTVGGVVQAARSIMRIVPVDEQLVVRVRISPRDVGHLETGLPVEVKISAYEFGRYGSVSGRLEAVSAASFDDGSGQRYFSGEISLAQAHVGALPGQYPITPGMTVSADIVTGSKTILQYLLQPVHSALSTALTER